MKYKSILLILILHLSIGSIKSQTKNGGNAIYERVLSYQGSSSISKAYFKLIFNENKSLFIQLDSTDHKEKVEKDNVVSLNVNLTSALPYAVFTNFLTNKIQSRSIIQNKSSKESVIVEELISKKKWNISNEYKKIGKLDCQKATLKFRGRKYTAWYSTKLHSRMGPWKFNNLPGLIIEVYDDSNEVYFGLRSIDFPFRNQEEIALNNEDKIKIITLKEYVKGSKKELDNILDILGSKLPRGVKMELTEKKIYAIEKEYEFNE
jgi:GLPGLI family protein